MNYNAHGDKADALVIYLIPNKFYFIDWVVCYGLFSREIYTAYDSHTSDYHTE